MAVDEGMILLSLLYLRIGLSKLYKQHVAHARENELFLEKHK